MCTTEFIESALEQEIDLSYFVQWGQSRIRDIIKGQYSIKYFFNTEVYGK